MQRPISSVSQSPVHVETMEERILFSDFSGGVLQSGFGSAGIGSVNLPFNANAAPAVMLAQADGGVIAIGSLESFDSSNDSAGVYLARFDSAGALSSSFGTSGVVSEKLSTKFGSSSDAIIDGAGESADGHIVVLATVTSTITRKKVSTTFTNAELLRFNADGTLDSHFGHHGVVAVPTTLMQTGSAIGVSSAGAVTIAGDYTLAQKSASAAARHTSATLGTDVIVTGGPASAFEVVRYTAKGRLDSSFGTSGAVRKHLEFSDSAGSLALNADGSVWVVGTVSYSTSNLSSGPAQTGAILRFDSHGRADSLFGSHGIVFEGEGGNVVIAAGPTGDLLLAQNGNPNAIQVADFTATGQLNSFFGDRGIASITPNDSSITIDQVKGMYLSADGHLMLASMAHQFDQTGTATLYEGFVARLNLDGTAESAFADNGQLITTSQITPGAFALGTQSLFVGGLPNPSSNGTSVTIEGQMEVAAYTLPTYATALASG